MRFLRSAVMFPLLFLAGTLHAEDAFFVEGLKYTAPVNGLRDGKLSATVGNAERTYDLSKVTTISLGEYPKFNDAEAARAAGDTKKAAALYREAMRTMNSQALKQLAEYRAIGPADEDGHWVDAVSDFLDLYQSSPIEAIWAIRPTHLPQPSSSMLRESAERVATAARQAKSDEARKNLKTFQLEILTQAGETEAAQRLAREITTGIAEDPNAPPKPREDPIASASAAVAEVDKMIIEKNYDGAIRKVDALLPISSPETCIQLFMLKARAYEGQGKFDLAAAALLRIPAHYPSSAAVPSALLQAAEMEKRAEHPSAAKALYQEIVESHPDSKEAITAKAASPQ